ncbi:MAG: UvrB/UvrC motif-containing protein [Cyanobacteria bacterium J06555_13]
MKEAAKKLEFEEASEYRDRIKRLRDRLLGKHKAPFRIAQDAARAASE